MDRAGHPFKRELRTPTVNCLGNELETAREPDTTSKTGRQMNCFKKEQRFPDSQKAGHHQPDWEIDALLHLDGKYELETARGQTPPARLRDK